MEFVPVAKVDYSVFHDLLNDYYREGEDVHTPQEQLDEFIRYLYGLCSTGRISGCIAVDNVPVGFVLWVIDSTGGPFSQKPGYGTILEIGISPAAREHGLGRKLVEYAQSHMNVPAYYVCAYGPAEQFWQKCGFADSGELADNGLKLMIKGD